MKIFAHLSKYSNLKTHGFFNTMRIQYVSDIHLEFESWRENFDDIVVPTHLVSGFDESSKLGNNTKNILILAGDICTTQHLDLLRRFLRYCRTNWEVVAYIPGNHEYYHTSIQAGNKILRKLCLEEDVLYCPKRLISIPHPNKPSSVKIICTSLWSNIDPNYEQEIVDKLNDYKLIDGFKPSDANRMHQEMKSFIFTTIENCRKVDENCQIIVATHHAPTLQGTCFPSHVGTPLNSAFCSDCTDIMFRKNDHADGHRQAAVEPLHEDLDAHGLYHDLSSPKVNHWIFGHTHYNPRHFSVGDTVLRSNQRGYKGSSWHYDSKATLVLE